MGKEKEASSAGSDAQAVEKLQKAYEVIRKEVAKVIIGQDEVVEELLIALFSQGHCILEGVPGLAKTLLVRALARTLSLNFSRIQFTPDLMPSDIIGTEIIQEDKATGTRELKFLQGPIFTNVLLADEINRTPPKTQAALLEAMQEKQVTVGRERYELAAPFFVLATQNPIEQEGTYPLPEAQLDRFMFKVIVGYPPRDKEFEIIARATDILTAEVGEVLDAEEIIGLRDIVRRVPVSEHVINYALDFGRRTRVGEEGAPEFIKRWVTWGVSPRACQFLLWACKARAVLNGRFYVSCEDVQALAKPVFRHRLITNFSAVSEGITTDDVVEKLIEETPAPGEEAAYDANIDKVLKEEMA